MSTKLEQTLQNISTLESMDYLSRIESLQKNLSIKENLPEEIASIDPRTGDKVVYSLNRKKRPHDYHRIYKEETIIQETNTKCPICEGKISEVWDKAPLSSGYTFINANLFPIVYPFFSLECLEVKEEQKRAFGTHLLQWHSSEHDKDFYNMPLSDIVICLERLAILEKYLLTQKSPFPKNREGFSGHLWIAKNYGRLSGSSLKHGHLQIIHSNILPSAIARDQELFQKENKGFSSFLQENMHQGLLIKSYSNGLVFLLTPFCMKRILQSVICFQDCKKNYLHSLNKQEIEGLAQALKDVISFLIKTMPELQREIAYNLLFHIGEIGGFYIEILPYTQEMGGYEYLGAYTCLLTPHESTLLYKSKI